MTTQARETHGMSSWFELMTQDVGAAKKFYGELLGWTLEDIDAQGQAYTLIKVGDEQIGGIMPLPPGVPEMKPMWNNYITVDDLDARLANVSKLGGKILVEPTGIPEVGRFALIADPQGAILYLMTWNKGA